MIINDLEHISTPIVTTDQIAVERGDFTYKGQVTELETPLGIPAIRTDIGNICDSLAAEYDDTATYAIGDYCVYEAALYKCNTTISTAEEWDAGHWTAVTVADNKQEKLVSGTNIKTVNGTSILGSGNISAGVNPNLLDNWYFVGGGSQQGGGQFPINQRGQTVYTGGMGIDRWTSDNGMTVSSGYIQTTLSGAVYQSVNDSLMKPLLGKTLTGTVLAYDGKLYTGTITLPSTYPGSTTVYDFYSASGVAVSIAMYNSGGGQALRFNVDAIAAKLELGSTQTLAHQENGVWVLNELPNFEEQLIRCKTSKADPSDTYANQIIAYEPSGGGLWFTSVAVAATTGDIATITDAAITSDYVLARIEWANPAAIVTTPTWTSSSGSFVINGKSTKSTTANVLLVLKNN